MSYISVRDARINNKMFQQALGNQQNTREFDILEKIYCYFSEPGKLDCIIPYIEESKNAMSLRDFESFNVHVSPWIDARFYKEQVIPGTNGAKSKELFIVYQKYKAQLKCYNKETFDPFRRGIAFEFYYTYQDPKTGEKEQRSIFTAICQLNYFLWCHSNGVLDYIQQNNKKISEIIKKIDYTKKHMSIEDFKAVILDKQRNPRYYDVKGISLSIPCEAI